MTYTIEQLQQAVPAAFATSPHSGVTDRYQFIPTAPLIQRLMDKGMVVTKAWQSIKRVNDPEHSIHRLRLTPPGATIVGGLLPQLDITNSHNRSCRLSINAGLYRLVCSNGLCIPIEGMSTHLERVHIVGLYSEALDDAIDHALTYIDTLPTVVSRMMWRNLNNTEQLLLARSAVMLRFNIAAPAFVTIYKPNWQKVLEPLRTADAEPTLWNTFNTLQEHLVRRGTLSQGRQLTAPRRDRDFNIGLWQLAQSYLN